MSYHSEYPLNSNDSTTPTANEYISLWLLSRGWELKESYPKGDIWRNEELNTEYVILNNLDAIPHGVEVFALSMKQFYPYIHREDLINFIQSFCKPSSTKQQNPL